MVRPKWYRYKNAEKYLYAQYKYVREVYKIPAKDIIKELGFTNRSSLFNLFSNHVYIKIEKLELFQKIFKFNTEEAEYLRLLTLHQKSSSKFEKTIWEEEINNFIAEYK